MNFTFISKLLHNFSIYTFVYILVFLYPSSELFPQEKILRFDHLTTDEGLAQNTIHGIVQDKYGFMWIGTWGGICRYDGYKFKIYRFETDNPRSIYNNRTEAIFKDSDNNIWIGFINTEIVCRYNYESDDFSRLNKSNVPKYIADSLNRESTIFYTYINTKEYLWKVNQSFNILTKNLPSEQINQLLIQTNKNTRKQVVYRTDVYNRWALSDEYIYDIFLDNNQILWVGTNSGGINWADTKQKMFYHYYRTSQKNNSIIDNVIRAICEDKRGNIWIGTHSKGITKIDKKNSRYIHYQYNANDPAHSLINNEIRSIYCDRYGFMWFGTKGGLDKFDPGTNQFSHYSVGSKKSIPHNWVYNILEDHTGYLWIGTWDGIAKYDRKNDVFFAYDPKLISNSSHIRVIFEDSKYNLWVATDGKGITRFRRDSSSGFEEKLYPARHYENVPANPNSLSSNQIYTMLEDENSIIWIGTDAGLNRFDPEKEKFTCFNTKSGLPNNMILGILNDFKGNLWFSHKNGITKFNIKTFNFKNYVKEDGLQANEFSEKTFFRSNTTGKMYFGGINGFNEFNPDEIIDNNIPPKTYITDLRLLNQPVLINQKINDQIILQKPIIITNEITLNYKNKKDITIEFAGLHYSNPKGNRYKYKLEGYDQDWIFTDASMRIAKYSNLDPQNYTFKVFASNSDGFWNTVPASLKITILPPWWQTWWFRSIVGFMVLLLAIFIVFRIIQKIKRLANQTILDERNQLHTLINNIPDQVFIKDTHSRFIYVNKSTITFMNGKSEKDFVNKTDYDFYPKEIADKFFEQEQKILSTDIPLINEEKTKVIDNKTFVYSTTKCPIKNFKGQTIGLVGIVRDISEYKKILFEIEQQSEELKNYNFVLSEANVLLEERQQQIEEQSEELRVSNEQLIEHQKLIESQSEELMAQRDQLSLLNATKDKLFSILAHDLRSPFNALIGYSQLLIKNVRKYPIEKIETQLNYILDSSKQTFYMLNNLLEWSRSQRETISFNPEPLMISHYLSTEMNILKQQALRKNITLEEKIVGTERAINADPNLISTVIRNLISNAIKYSFNDKTILITLVYNENEFLFSVKDQGTGIKPDVKEKLFKISNIGSMAGTMGEKGTGLGLLICADFIAKHNGKIWVESEVNKGSEFCFTIPF